MTPAKETSQFADWAAPNQYLVGEQLTVADCAWPTTLVHLQRLLPALGHQFVLPSNLTRWHAHLASLAVFEPLVAECEAAMEEWLQRKLG